MVNQDKDSFVTLEEANSIASMIYHPSLYVEEVIDPKGYFYNVSVGDDPGEKQYTFKFTNGFLSNAGLIANSINKDGVQAAKNFIYQQMITAGFFVPSWVMESTVPSSNNPGGGMDDYSIS